MLSRWFNTKRKAAEQALAEGRLDEALYRIGEIQADGSAVAPELLAELARLLTARARVAAHAGRYREALTDLQRLTDFKVADADALALRQRVEEELKIRIDRHVHADEAAQKAAQKIGAGRLESGLASVERIEDPRKRERLREELDIRIQRSDELIAKAREALQQSDPVAAARYWSDAIRGPGSTGRTEALAAELTPACRALLDELFTSGRLDRFEATVTALDALIRSSPALAEFDRLAQHVRRASREIPSSDPTELRDVLLRMKASRGGLSWIDDTLATLDAMGSARQRLLTSPLGLLAESRQESPRVGVATFPPSNELPPIPRAGQRPMNRLLLVDGTGSALLLGREVIRIGRAGGSSIVDLALPADVHSHHADIVRRGDEYFLVARGPARVNHQAVSQALLKDNDRIVLGEGGKFVFRRPSAKSESAVLLLSDRCRLPGDVSMVVLFRQTCLLGPNPSCHIRTREGQTRLVFFERDGLLVAREATYDGRPQGPAVAVAADRTQDIGDVRVTMKDLAADA